MRRNRKVKILATLGPASSNVEMIEALFQAGADVFRINMSHASHDVMRDLVRMIRSVEAKYDRPIGILVDLQGPKLRVGSFADGSAELEVGQEFVLDDDETLGDRNRVYLPHLEIFDALEPGHSILLDDGKVRLKVKSVEGKRAVTVVEAGRKLSNRKGVSLPDTLLLSGALTPKDRKDLEAALPEAIDWVALSFVQRAEDVAEARKIIRGKFGIMSKIEKPQAVENIEEIIELSDAIMVARGDLGVEMPLELVPGIQKRLTRLARRAGKPVVVATQMLESMITAAVPTRAEVSDVATAVFEGADAVMLSAESAAGDFPVEAVSTMNRVAEACEKDYYYPQIIHAQRTEPETTGADTITASARQVAETLNLAAIICLTASGRTALRASRERPGVPIIGMSPTRETARRLAVAWGVHSVVAEDVKDVDDMVNQACRIAHDEGFAEPGGRVIIAAGAPFGRSGGTNMLRIAFISPDGHSGY
ncbi:pyruvate kinase [Faunimonas pinastri]|uniref:Pyruvate kinase n=1 Tax=Faunimonas pinastri TaxID=1855383 RepID=A0A1H8Z228_9HYPH|nr:pyruvate kinase [Faunimonas pinastri]SEP58416.1 pyruvate kinase [Faunimonas pinastri]